MLTLLRVLALVGSWNAVLGGGYEPDRAVSVAASKHILMLLLLLLLLLLLGVVRVLLVGQRLVHTTKSGTKGALCLMPGAMAWIDTSH